MMKNVFKSGALATIRGNNQFRDQYDYLIKVKNYSERDARNAIARQIATVVYGMMKNKKRYDPQMYIKFKREKLNYVSEI